MIKSDGIDTRHAGTRSFPSSNPRSKKHIINESYKYLNAFSSSIWFISRNASNLLGNFYVMGGVHQLRECCGQSHKDFLTHNITGFSILNCVSLLFDYQKSFNFYVIFLFKS